MIAANTYINMSKYALKRINTCKIGVTRQLVPFFNNTITEEIFSNISIFSYFFFFFMSVRDLE